MGIKAIIVAGYSFLLGLTKKKLVDIILHLREEYTKAQAQIKRLKAKNAKLQDENVKLKEELKQHKIKGVNRAANKPSSKQAEWEDKGGKRDQNHEDKKHKKRARKPRAGAGNQAKQREPNRTETATVAQCDRCGKDLRGKPALASCNERIVEDILDPVEKTDVINIIQENKEIPRCLSTSCRYCEILYEITQNTA